MAGKVMKMMEEVLGAPSFPDDIKEKAEKVIIDTIIASLYGLKTEGYLKEYISNIDVGQSEQEGYFPLLGEKVNIPIKDNLIITGTSIVANELDEGNQYAKGHPSAHIFPGLYISALKNNVSNDQVIEAFLRGYEIASRIAYASQMRDDMHPHGTWGNIGGTIASGILEGKSTENIIQSAMLSASLPLSTSWLAAEKGQTVRNMYTGIGAFLSYECISLNDYGVTTSEDVFSDLWNSILSEGFQEEKLDENLLDPPLIMKNYFKVHPSCRFTHGAIDAMLEIKTKYRLKADDIKRIEVYTYSLAARCRSKVPVTSLESKFSIPYMLAKVIHSKNLFDQPNEGDYKESEIYDLAECIEVYESEEMNNFLPESRVTEVHLFLEDGCAIKERVHTAKGEHTNPFSNEEMWKKYKSMLEPFYSKSQMNIFKNNLFTMRTTENFTEWLKMNLLI